MNNVTLIGRLTKDSELKFAEGSGTAICKFSLAVDRDYKGKDGKRETDFINCTAFNKLAESLSPYLIKGKLIAIFGRIQVTNYTNKDGHKVYSTDIIVEKIQFLDKKTDGPAIEEFHEVVGDDDIAF